MTDLPSQFDRTLQVTFVRDQAECSLRQRSRPEFARAACFFHSQLPVANLACDRPENFDADQGWSDQLFGSGEQALCFVAAGFRKKPLCGDARIDDDHPRVLRSSTMPGVLSERTPWRRCSFRLEEGGFGGEGSLSIDRGLRQLFRESQPRGFGPKLRPTRDRYRSPNPAISAL